VAEGPATQERWQGLGTPEQHRGAVRAQGTPEAQDHGAEALVESNEQKVADLKMAVDQHHNGLITDYELLHKAQSLTVAIALPVPGQTDGNTGLKY
jgi:hypothetical protein